MKIRSFAVTVFSIFLFSSVYAQQQEQVTLEQVIALALEKNYDVRLASNTAEVYAKDRSYVWSGFTPQVNGTASAVKNANNQEVRFQETGRNNEGEAESTNITASVQLNWVLFDGSRMFATAARLQTMDAQGQLIVKAQMVNTIAQVINNYYDIVRQKQQLKAVQEQMAVSNERVKLADRKLQVGTGGKPELLQAKVDYNAQLTQTYQQEALIAQLKEQLNALVDAQLPTGYDVTDSIMINLNLRQEEIASNLELTNYDLRASKMNMHAAGFSVWERYAELSPTITFNAALNYSRVDNTKLINSLSPVFNQTDGLNYGFTLNVPIFNGLNGHRLIQQAKINYHRQELFYNQLKVNTNAGLRNAYVNYENAKKVLLVEEETILLAKENVYIALESFKRGLVTFIELRTAQQSLADAYNRLINARYLAKVAETELLRINGELLK